MSPIQSGSLLKSLVQAVGYFLNIFTRKFSLNLEEETPPRPETINTVNVTHVALVRMDGYIYIYNDIHALGLLTLLISFSGIFFSSFSY